MDDSPFNIFVLKELISLEPSLQDYEIDTALNGQEALENVCENCSSGGGNGKCKYSFIIMDLHMPIMDGEQSASHMR